MLSYFSQQNDSMFMLPFFERDRHLHTGPPTRRRVNAQVAPKLCRPALHILQPVTSSASVCGSSFCRHACEPTPVITDFGAQSVVRDSNVERDRGTLGMPGDVIDSFFEDQKQVTAL